MAWLYRSIIIINNYFCFLKRRKIVKSSKFAAYFLYTANLRRAIDSGMVGTKWLGLRKEFKISFGLRQLLCV